MEELRKILREAIGKLRKPINSEDEPHFKAFDTAYNLALDDVIYMVINKIPD